MRPSFTVFEIRLVEQVEELRPELDRPLLAPRPLLEQGGLDVSETRTAGNGAAGIAEPTIARKNKGACVEPHGASRME